MRLMIYAHYDKENIIMPYVQYFLKTIKELYDEIIFVTNANINEVEKEKIKDVCNKIIHHENIGFDFGMWKFVIKKLNTELYDEITLTNSSVYGPIFPMQDIFSRMDMIDCDFWGITESYEHDRHLQSYFLVFKRNVIRSEIFKTFWDGVLEYKNKFQIIRSYEIGLTQWLLQHGYKMAAFCSWQRLVKSCVHKYKKQMRQPINPTIMYGIELLKLKTPFVKVELIRDNPYKRDLQLIKNLIEATDYPIDYINNDNVFDGTGDYREKRETCSFCNSNGKMLYRKYRDRYQPYSTEKWRIWHCTNKNCGVSWLRPFPTEIELKEAYQHYYTHGTCAFDEYVPPQYSFAGRMMLSICKRLLKAMKLDRKRGKFYFHGLKDKLSGRALEVGCGSGDRLVALRKLGWEVEGYEVDGAAEKFCVENHGLKIHNDMFELLKSKGSSYDVVLMSHVLEHVDDPQLLMGRCMRLLKPGGQLLVTTPNLNSLGRIIYGKYWFPLDPPRHLLLYTPLALKKLISDAGFSEINISTVALNFELVSLHSRDIRYTTFTDFNDMPRIGKELVPVVLQLISLIFHAIFPNSGEECFAKAIKSPDSSLQKRKAEVA